MRKTLGRRDSGEDWVRRIEYTEVVVIVVVEDIYFKMMSTRNVPGKGGYPMNFWVRNV
jgi:hypothetical protein